jgi:phospholipid/cholesterol/gamma-HCH transport system substrate-binding protein
MSRQVRARLVVFAVISAVAVTYAGARYARLTDHVLGSQYQITVQLERSGGLYAGAEVTYRGVAVGKVADLRLNGSGVDAVLTIGDEWQIPDSAFAAVHNRSAVGEQFIDLSPDRSGGPYLHDGSAIPRPRSSTPLQEETLLATVDALVRSVDRRDLQVVVSELGTAFRGAGRDVELLLDGAGAFIDAANDHLPATVALLQHTETVLRTQQHGASDIQTFTRGLASLSETLRSRDRDIRTWLNRGAPAADELAGLVNDLSGVTPRLLADLRQLLPIITSHLPGVAQILSVFPWDVATIQPAARDGRAHLSLTLSPTPPGCQRGYLAPDFWRSTQDTTDSAPLYAVECAEPDRNWRGEAHAQP